MHNPGDVAQCLRNGQGRAWLPPRYLRSRRCRGIAEGDSLSRESLYAWHSLMAQKPRRLDPDHEMAQRPRSLQICSQVRGYLSGCAGAAHSLRGSTHSDAAAPLSKPHSHCRTALPKELSAGIAPHLIVEPV